MKQAEVMDLTKIAQSIPSTPEPEINRDNILETVDTLFNSGTQIIIIEGEDGIGKTNLLSQFVRKYPDNAISIFITPNCLWGYDPHIIRRDLFDQIRWVLEITDHDDSEYVDESNFGTCIYGLRKKSKRERQIFYFIIDGLLDIPKERVDIQRDVLRWLPFSFSEFRFLLSGDLSKLLSNSLKGINIKNFPLTGFTLDETKTYFRDIVDNPESIEEVHKICKGIPGYLESVSRNVQDDTDIQSIIDEMPDHLPCLFELEWKKVRDDDNQLILLAIIAHDRWQHTVEELADILNVNIENIHDLLKDLPFISTEGKHSEVSFVSDVFRKFAISQLKGLKNRVNEILIESLLNKGDSYLSYKYLPMLYQELGKSEELLNYLSSEQADKLVDHFKSIAPLQQKAIMGVTTALKLNRGDDLVKFSMQASALRGLCEINILHSEIEALMSLDKYESAIKLAHSNVIYEEKLQRLCIIAKSKTEQGLSPDEDLIDQIKELYEKIDFDSIGERAIDIASNLIYSIPELAIDLIEKTTKNSSQNNSVDWAFTKLSFAVLGDSSKNKTKFDAIESIKPKISDPKFKKFSTAITLLLGEYSPEKVISESNKMQNPDDQLFLLRHWTMRNQHRDDAEDVIEFALTLVIKSTTFSPTAKVLYELSVPLPNIKDTAKIKLLVGRFDTFIDTAKRLGPTKDYVNLQLILSNAESKYNFEKAENRIIEIYFYIDELDDILLKTECLISLMVALKQIDPSMNIENKHDIYSSIQADLTPNIENLLKNTADHYTTSRDIIRSLTKSEPDIAINLALQLNTEDRRDQALLEFIKTSLKRPSKEIDLNSIKNALSRIVDKDLVDSGLYKIIERYYKIDGPEIDRGLLPFISQTEKIANYVYKCKALAYSFVLLKKSTSKDYSSLTDRLLKLLLETWNSIDVEWEKIDTGYNIVKIIAPCSIDTSQKLLSSIEDVRKNVNIDSNSTATSYINFIRLAIRSLSGLMARKLDSSDDLEELSVLIEQIVSNVVRASLWARLAIRYYISDRKNKCQKIVTERVKPLIQILIKENSDDKIHAIIECAPALYCAHKNSAFEIISHLPPYEKDYALNQICEFLIIKHPPSDPFDKNTTSKFILDYEKLLDVCEIIDKIENDSFLYRVIEKISDNIKARRRRYPLSNDQLNDILEKIKNNISTKLPNSAYIKHDGYKIAANAQLLSIRKGNPQEWKDLIQEALQIPNIADKSHVLLIIAVTRPPKYSKDRLSLIKESIEMINSIPSSVEKIEHYEGLISHILDIEPSLGRECLKEAMKQSLQSDNPEYASAQKRIVDIAYRYDHEFAASLAAMADDDPGRVMARANISDRMNVLELKQKLIEKSQNTIIQEEKLSDYPSAAWMRLGALNSGRVEAVHINETYSLAEIAASLPINDAYPIFSFIIENAIVRYSKTDQAGVYFRPMFKAATTAATLSLKLVKRSLQQRNIPSACTINNCTTDSVIIRSGEREKAEQFIRKWFEKNVKKYLKICDPWFGPEELDLIKLFTSLNPDVEIFILTSKKHQKQESVSGSIEEHYRNKWRLNFSDNDPLSTDFIIVGTKSSGALPIHDRWWISEKGGLRFGASFNGIGIKKDSEISILSADESINFEKEIDKYLNNSKREHQGEKLMYTRFNL